MDSREQKLYTKEFLSDNFEVDEYLSKCTQKSDLLTLKNDLKSYGSDLQTQMVGILKTETEDIINLAENLANLDSEIHNLYDPLAQLTGQIEAVSTTVQNSKQDFKTQLEKLDSIALSRKHLNLKIGLTQATANIEATLSSSVALEDVTVLDRIVSEFSFHLIHLKELGLESVVAQDDQIMKTAAKLIELASAAFLKAVKANDEDSTLKCLRMFVSLDAVDEAERRVREEIVRLRLSGIFSQRKLEASAEDLKGLFEEALQLLDEDLKLLLTVTKGNADIEGFGFVTRSFWREADAQIRTNLPNITAPGNPDQFQRRFKDTFNFLDGLVSNHNDGFLLEDDSLHEHLKRFNLAVYFEIRFQQIATKFEKEALRNSVLDEDYAAEDSGPFRLKVTRALRDCTVRCFDPDVFLVQMADQIFKLAMMLLSRYFKSLDTNLEMWQGVEASNAHKLERFLVYALIDVTALKSAIAAESEIFAVVHHEMRGLLKRMLQFNANLLEEYEQRLRQKLIDIKVQQCLGGLQMVSAIPRIYRRTNKSPPKEPSGYVTEVVGVITDFHGSNAELMDWRISDGLIFQLSERYISFVHEVLSSVSKTEESLRRLKSRTLNTNDDGSAAQAAADVTSDEAKIREQIRLDVSYFVGRVRVLSCDDKTAEALNKLMQKSGCE